MKRRTFLQFLGLVPAAVAVGVAARPEPTIGRYDSFRWVVANDIEDDIPPYVPPQFYGRGLVVQMKKNHAELNRNMRRAVAKGVVRRG